MFFLISDNSGSAEGFPDLVFVMSQIASLETSVEYNRKIQLLIGSAALQMVISYLENISRKHRVRVCVMLQMLSARTDSDK